MSIFKYVVESLFRKCISACVGSYVRIFLFAHALIDNFKVFKDFVFASSYRNH